MGLTVAPVRGVWSPVRPSLLEFIVHGVRYVWPATAGPVKRGVPTPFGTELMADSVRATRDMDAVVNTNRARFHRIEKMVGWLGGHEKARLLAGLQAAGA